MGIILPLYHTQCLPLYKFFWVTHHVHLIHVFLMIGERGKGVYIVYVHPYSYSSALASIGNAAKCLSKYWKSLRHWQGIYM